MKWPKWRKNKPASVEIAHYAPEVTLTAVDYLLPDAEKRLQEAEALMSDFLQQTAPDRLCEGFFDAQAEAQEELLLADLRVQGVEHTGSNRSIAAKHRSELQRLRSEIGDTEQLLQQLERELAAQERLYAMVNGGVADEQ